MLMNKSTVVGVALILGFGVLGAGAMKKFTTPYVTVPEARQSGDMVQVYGEINQKALKFDRASQEITFPLTDLKHNTMLVHYRGVRPGNLSQASHCVATGRFENGEFTAQSLLIKCPSKYQGE